MNYELKFIKAKKEIANFLIKLREEAKYTSPFQVAEEIETSRDGIYKLEKGTYVPTKSILKQLYKVYKMNEVEIKMLEIMCLNARELRKLARINEHK